MAIRYQPKGYGELVQGLAQQAGEAVAAREAAKISAQIEAQRESQVRSMQFEKQMREIDHQMELEKFARSKAWDIEKMETASRLDFEYEEKKRLKQKEQLDADLEALRKAKRAGLIDEETMNNALAERQLRELKTPGAAAELYKTDDKVLQRWLLQQQMKKPTPTAVKQASEGLEELEKKRERKWYLPWFMEKKGPRTPEDIATQKYYQDILKRAGATTQMPTNQITGAEGTVGDYPVYNTSEEADEALNVGDFWRDRTGQLWQVTK